MKSGTWALVCTKLARPYSGPLSTLLANAAPERRASMQLEEALRVIDHAAHILARKLDAAERSAPVARPPQIERRTQAECMVARRGKLHFDWPPGWDLGAEIEAIFRPLARQAAACSQPSSLITDINTVIDATHESISEIAVLVAKADAAARSAHVPVDQRGVARRLVLDLFQRPVRPEIADSDLARGRWVTPLCKLAEPYSGPLSQLLATDARVGGESVSDRLDAALRRIDAAALTLARRIEAVSRSLAPSPAAPAPAPTVTSDKADRARAELSRLGVPLP